MEKKILYLSKDDVIKTGISIDEVITTVDDIFKKKGKGLCEMPPKPGVHPGENSFLHAMPAYIKDHSVGIKWIGAFPDNGKKGLPVITGLIILNDINTGLPLAIMDATYITGLRTAAASAVGFKYLGRKNSSSLGIIGLGVQGQTHLLAFYSIMENLKEVRVFDINPDKTRDFIKKNSSTISLPIKKMENVEKLIKESDVIITAIPIQKDKSPFIEPDWFNKGAFGCAIDFDTCWKPEAMSIADKIFTDDISQFSYYKKERYFQDAPEISGELADVILNKKIGREKDDDRILFIPLGLAIEDISVAKLVYELALEKKVGSWVLM